MFTSHFRQKLTSSKSCEITVSKINPLQKYYYLLTSHPLKMAIIKPQVLGRREKPCTLWEYKLVQPMWKHPHRHLSVIFSVIAFLTGVRWYLSVVLICISLLIYHAQPLFMCILVICMSSSEKNVYSHLLRIFKSFSAYLKICLFGFEIELYELFNIFWILTLCQSFLL